MHSQRPPLESKTHRHAHKSSSKQYSFCQSKITNLTLNHKDRPGFWEAHSEQSFGRSRESGELCIPPGYGQAEHPPPTPPSQSWANLVRFRLSLEDMGIYVWWCTPLIPAVGETEDQSTPGLHSKSQASLGSIKPYHQPVKLISNILTPSPDWPQTHYLTPCDFELLILRLPIP